jgi:acyl-CoA thioesterase I
MDGGMARTVLALRMARVSFLAGAFSAVVAAIAALSHGTAAQTTSPEPPPVAKECGDVRTGDTPLPNSALALQQRKKIKILAIGASPASVLGLGRGGTPPLLERILERTIKGLDVEIINRGFSGELAEAAGERLKIEVALNNPDIVLWQVGTNDALAQVPVEDFQNAVSDTVRWLKEHNIDVILVGLHYMKQLAKDEHYQAIRAALQRIANSESVLRIGRYEAMEVLANTVQSGSQPEPQDFGLSEAGYNCMAQYIARTITVGVFAKARRFYPPPDPPPSDQPR